jgi:capsular polysaccharide biosynthesis protein
MNEGGDVLSALGWGLRKFAWLVALFVLALGVLVPYWLSRGADVYDAQTQVGPKKILNLPNLDPLPRLGDTVFNNGAVADAVRKQLKLPATKSVVGSGSPGVELVAAQDNVVFTVIGHGSTPQQAKNIADTAASAFTIELNKYSNPARPDLAAVGEFLVQHASDLPTKPAAKLGGGTLSVVIGLIAGAVAGVGVVGLLLVLRRPVLDSPSAQQATGVPVMGNVRLPRKSGSLNDREFMGVAALCRRTLEGQPDRVLLTSPPKATAELRQLGSAMQAFLERRGNVQSIGTSPADADAGAAPGSAQRRVQFIVADHLSLDQIATLPASALTLLVVPRGTRLRVLRETAAEYFTGGPAGLVLVDRARWYRRGRRANASKRSRSSGSSSPSTVFPPRTSRGGGPLPSEDG